MGLTPFWKRIFSTKGLSDAGSFRLQERHSLGPIAVRVNLAPRPEITTVGNLPGATAFLAQNREITGSIISKHTRVWRRNLAA